MEEFPPNADSLMRILRRLRAPDGCPWDRKQTRKSLGSCFAGEAAEVIDAIDRDDAENLREELGDVLMNILFQVVIAEEKNEFDLESVWREIIDKMIRRHVHIFGDAKAETPEEVAALWQKVKAAEHAGETAPPSVMDGVKPALSALDRAEKLQRKAAGVGFDWRDLHGILAKVREEADEVEEALASGSEAEIDEEIGDLLFAASNLARFRGRESAGELLRRANRKFERRFRAMEAELKKHGEDPAAAAPERMEAVWDAVKAGE